MKISSNTDLELVDLDISDIEFECFVWDAPSSSHKVGVIAFHGEYKSGREGKADAIFMKWKLSEFLDAYILGGIVVDFRDLEYSWGNALGEIMFIPCNRLTGNFVRVVVPKENREAYDKAIEQELIMTDLDDALAYLDRVLTPR